MLHVDLRKKYDVNRAKCRAVALVLKYNDLSKKAVTPKRKIAYSVMAKHYCEQINFLVEVENGLNQRKVK